MKRKRKKKIPEVPAENRERHERTQRKLAERIAYHERKIAKKERERPSS